MEIPVSASWYFALYFFIWLCQVLVAACGSSVESCGILICWPGIKPTGSLHWEHCVLSHLITREDRFLASVTEASALRRTRVRRGCGRTERKTSMGKGRAWQCQEAERGCPEVLWYSSHGEKGKGRSLNSEQYPATERWQGNDTPQMTLWGMGCHYTERVKVLVTQLVPTLCDPMDCHPPGFSAHGIYQARRLEWVVIPFSRGSFQPRDESQVSCIAGRFFTIWTTREANLVTNFFISWTMQALILISLCNTTCNSRLCYQISPGPGLPWSKLVYHSVLCLLTSKPWTGAGCCLDTVLSTLNAWPHLNGTMRPKKRQSCCVMVKIHDQDHETLGAAESVRLLSWLSVIK